MRRRDLLGLSAGIAIGGGWLGGPGAACSAPRAELWPRWQAHDPGSSVKVPHKALGAWLKSFVRQGHDGMNRVDYRAVKSADKVALEAYLAQLTEVAVAKLDRPEQCAYWINLYNALTLKVVLDHYPVRSIRDIDISPGLLSDGPWGAKLVRVEAQELALDDIEHRILRPIWQDPRVHYGINCASIGCPNLQVMPFHGARLDAQLDGAATAYINHSRGMTLENGRLTLSSIYKWFAVDFGGDDRGVIQHLMAYVRPELAMDLQKVDRIAGYGYDWALNDLS